MVRGASEILRDLGDAGGETRYAPWDDAMKTRVDAEEICRKGRAIYDRQLKELLEPEHEGRYVAIGIDEGGHFLGDTGSEALSAARARHPDQLFFLARLGRQAAHFHRGVR